MDYIQVDSLILTRIREIRAEPDLAADLATHFASKLNCSVMGMEYNFVHVTGG